MPLSSVKPGWRWSARMVAVVATAASLFPVPSGGRTSWSHPTLLSAPRNAALAFDDALWLHRGDIPGEKTPWAAMNRDALIDLHRLSSLPPNEGGIAGGAARSWSYTWPRDASFAAAALARTGHAREALAAVRFLERVQEPDGGFEARYLPSGDGPPDDRPRQSDGAGWVLWGLDQVSRATDGGSVADEASEAREILREHHALLDRATDFILRQTAHPGGLPAPSPDYWELHETRLTLGVAAPLLAGLQASSRMYAVLGERGRALRSAAAARRLERAVVARFGPGGYQRYGNSGGVDAATCFLLEPFVHLRNPGPVIAAWRRYQVTALRPGGGLAPGVSWRRDGISWTPETALVALTAAALSERSIAEHWMGWLDQHRTTWGSLPEKVRPDGQPAGPAPLTWTAAIVVLTTLELTTSE